MACNGLCAHADAFDVPRPVKPGVVRPGPWPGEPARHAHDPFAVGPYSLAGAVDLPDAARPGAIRPGEDRKQIPREPPPEPVFDVPPVADRPLEIDEGEKILVARFVLEGVEDRPEHDIAVSAIEALVDARRQERPDGFTVGRLQELADEITAYYRERGLILAEAGAEPTDDHTGHQGDPCRTLGRTFP